MIYGIVNLKTKANVKVRRYDVQINRWYTTQRRHPYVVEQ